MDTTTDGDDRATWAPRVSPAAIRRLYQTDALGIIDEEQIADVGGALAARCRSILQVTAAHRGRATCPHCGRPLRRPPDGAPLRCRGCGWQATPRDYRRSYQHRQLYGGGAVACFEAYLEEYARARSPQQRMIAIDRLLHAFHGQLATQPGRPAAKNLIELPTTREALAFLDRLASGEASSPGVAETRQTWAATMPHKVSKRLRRGLGRAEDGEASDAGAHRSLTDTAQ